MRITQDTKICIDNQAIAILEAACNQAAPDEVSGLAFAYSDGRNIVIYDAAVLNVGSYGYTEINPLKIDPAKVAELLTSRDDAKNLKCWWHRHPIDGWSATDEHTCTKAPLGLAPEMVRWAVAVVRTPKGWIGRVDLFKGGKATTHHLQVVTPVDAVIQETLAMQGQPEWVLEQDDFEYVGERDENQLELWRDAWGNDGR